MTALVTTACLPKQLETKAVRDAVLAGLIGCDDQPLTSGSKVATCAQLQAALANVSAPALSAAEVAALAKNNPTEFVTVNGNDDQPLFYAFPI